MYNVIHISIERRFIAKCSTAAIRIGPEVKDWSSEIFDELGLSLSTAANIFLRAVARRDGLPLDVAIMDNEEDGM